MRHFARDDGTAQSALGTVVGGLDLRALQKEQDLPVIVLPPNPFQRTLVAGVPQPRVQFFPEGPAALPVLLKGAGPGAVVLPEFDGFAQGGFELTGEGPRPPASGFLNGAEVFEEMAQAFLLPDGVKGSGFITAAAVGAREAREGGA